MASSQHSDLPEHARDWIKIPLPPERLEEIRSFADSDILDMVEPEEMYWFLGLIEQQEALEQALREIEMLGETTRNHEAQRLYKIAREALASTPAKRPSDD